ncbi:nicotinate-nucleotide adenylyltransferase [Vagococcus xieshaowenii]|uniref:Probable nicotinate-nucleotide adenylyltransferase n=1 Tax=Vagococcus xieshaowenii TaxID=2562451 RepID=A0AAJ5EFZ2_9ENTE|nr:nicotinate-nucleotide adenylyltransferase [Vagococcus xieshaowenii]QCA28318.1 nicotinate-nucleotide adenylyltransferase [Vagococcus xieshaowenii]TFZ42294.1 nicotinate-nucleotide adenylyltransferase [Vagococcus xieshaowenii]
MHRFNQLFSEPLTQVKVEVSTINQRKRVGILGGSFNPVHYAHLMMIDQVHHQLGLDEVYLMPTNIPPHKEGKKTLDSKHRVAMLTSAVTDFPHIGIETIELERDQKSYTFDTMMELQKRHPEVDYFFIIGGDMVEDLPNWYHIEELQQMVQFVAVRRPGYEVQSDYPLIWVDIPQMDISSTTIRHNIATDCSVNFMLPTSVIDYIRKEGLYRDEV